MESTIFGSNVTVSINDFDQLIRDSERLEIITEYAKNSKYVDKDTLLILLGFEPKENTNNQ